MVNTSHTSPYPNSNYQQDHSYSYTHAQSSPIDNSNTVSMAMTNDNVDSRTNGGFISGSGGGGGSDNQNGFTTISHPMHTLAGVSPLNSGFRSVGVSGFPNGLSSPPLPPKRRPGRPPVYVFTKPDSELSENERRLKGAVLKRRMRQNRSYHRKKRLRQSQPQPNSQPTSPEHHPHHNTNHYSHPYDSVDTQSQYPTVNNTSSNNLSIPPLALPTLQPPQSNLQYNQNAQEQSQQLQSSPQVHGQEQQQQPQQKLESTQQLNHQSHYSRPTLSSFSLSPSVPTLVVPNRHNSPSYNHEHNPSRSHMHTTTVSDRGQNMPNGPEIGTSGNNNNAIATVLSQSNQNDDHHRNVSKTLEPISPTSFAPSSNSTAVNSTAGSQSTSASLGHSHPGSYSHSHSPAGSLKTLENTHENVTSPRSGDENRALQQLLDLSTPTAPNPNANTTSHVGRNGPDVSSPMNTTSLINTNLESYAQHQQQSDQQKEQQVQSMPISHHQDVQYPLHRRSDHRSQGQRIESLTPNQMHNALSSPVNFDQADTQQGQPQSHTHSDVHSHAHQHQHQPHQANYSVIPVQ